MRSWFAQCCVVVLSATLAGCSIRSSDGHTVHHLVLGIGVVSVSNDAKSVDASDGVLARVRGIRSTGLLVNIPPDGPGLLIGQHNSQSVEILPEAELTLDAMGSEKGISVVARGSKTHNQPTDEMLLEPKEKETP
jgi:hypothetical protein